MKAALLTRLPSVNLDVRDVPEPEPGPESVMVSVEACGMSGTDIHIMDGVSYRPELPFILGHEPVGVVSAVGDGIDSDLIGARVVPTLFLGCKECGPCRSGDERLCEKRPSITGVSRPGGFAERVVLSVSQLVSVPSQLSSQVAASLVDAGATAYNATRVALDRAVDPQGAHLIVGAGPVGFLVADLLRHRGALVQVLETNPARRLRA